MTDDLAAHALAFARRGWPVLPCHHPGPAGCSCGRPDCASPAKHPRTRRGLHDASTELAQVHRWWRRWPEANVGVRTGMRPAGAGLVIVDVDPAHGGEATLAALAGDHGSLPDTLEATTGGGGRHLYFAHPGGPVPNSAGRLGPGLDVRGDGGYVLAPASKHASGGRYQWRHRSAVAPLPAWLHGLVLPPAPDELGSLPSGSVREPGAWAAAALADEVARVRRAVEGTRNHTLNRAAFALGQLVAGGHLDEADVTERLVEASLAAGLGLREARATVASGLRAGGAWPRHARSGDTSLRRPGRPPTPGAPSISGVKGAATVPGSRSPERPAR